MVITPYSTGITERLIPKAAVDKFRFCYGLSASADGQLFPWVFNPPDTYWDGASAFIRHVADVEGSFAKLRARRLASCILMHHTAKSRFRSRKRLPTTTATRDTRRRGFTSHPSKTKLLA